MNRQWMSFMKTTDIQSGTMFPKRQYEVRAALRNLLEYRRYGKNQKLSYAVVQGFGFSWPVFPSL